MSTLTAFVGLVVAVFAIIAGFFAAARAIWRAATSTQNLVGAVEDNTQATEKLSGDLKEFSTATARTLADHGERITRLEKR